MTWMSQRKEAHVGDTDIEHCRFDIDRHMSGRGRSFARNERAEGGGSRADAAAQLAAFFVADKGKEQSGIDFNSCTIEGPHCLERQASPAFRSLAPRPQTAPSATAPENGLSRFLAADRSFQPRVCTVSV